MNTITKWVIGTIVLWMSVVPSISFGVAGIAMG